MQPANGTCARSFPRCDQESESVAQNPTIRTRLETVMIVDDEPTLRDIIQFFLAEVGYTVIPLSNGQSALHQCQEKGQRPDLVILDLSLPDMNGLECLQRLRQFDPDLKVLVATGHLGRDVENLVWNSGANGLIHKPFDDRELCCQIRAILDGNPPKRGSPSPQGGARGMGGCGSALACGVRPD